MKYSALSAVVVALLLSTIFFWRNSGEGLTLTVPTSVTITEGDAKTAREINFLRHWPIFGWYSSREIKPSLQGGNVIQVDLSSTEITQWGWSHGGKAFRVNQKVGEEISHTYFLSTDKVVQGAKRVTLRIKNHDSIADAIHQQRWFWIREFYDCEVLAVS